MATKLINTQTLTNIANAIRTKTGTSEPIAVTNMATEIGNIPTGGGDTLKALLDVTKSCANMFNGNNDITDVSTLFTYNSTANVTNMSGMFQNCANLTIVPLLNTANVTDMSQMFMSCSKLTQVPLFDTSKVTNMTNMFYYARQMTSIPAFDVSKVTNMANMLAGDYNIEEIHMTNISIYLDISGSTKFTREALLEIIGNLSTVTTTQKLKMGSTNLAKLTDEDKAIATGKGWTLA